MREKNHVEKLSSEWSGSDADNSQAERDILDELRPHKKIKELEISGYRGMQFPNWLADHSFLKLLVTEEFYGSPSSKKPFNSLEKLEIAKMPEWKQWHVLGNGEFPALQDLSVTTRTEALAVTRASRIIKAREFL
ncbi:putative disease resistance RPP13-like protein 1 [Capsicum annuum]|uniref:putative disease resistance RPP13-like protein 1 n=1 Tax=Capsicum annuum TaxID=4072 RepID=UPI001FB0B238|nr:putative disease resistance RPP13-like protein 1 [Capsicum annuum]